MPATKRRKVAVTSSRIAPASNRSVAQFAKITKAQVTSKIIQEKKVAIESSTDFELVSDGPKRKRKAPAVAEIVDDRDEEEEQVAALVAATINRTYEQKDYTIRLQEQPLAEDKPLQQDELPREIVDLIHLHSSFLTALSLQYAHNGTQSPVDLRTLCPDISKAWGKRKVMIIDIRRTLAVLKMQLTDEIEEDTPLTALRLSNYGQGKICIENDTHKRHGGWTAQALDESRMNEKWSRNIRYLWNEWTKRGMTSVKDFIEQLPVEEITICSSLRKVSTIQEKGQQRLEDMKAGIIVRKEAEKPKISISRIEKGGRASLLERLKTKQFEKSFLPTPPSKEELERNAALTKLMDVTAFLTLFSTSGSLGQQRVSFTMPTILGKLKDSLKTPLSREEGAACIKLLAREIAPEWLRIVNMGKFEAVVVDRENRPRDSCIQERIESAG